MEILNNLAHGFSVAFALDNLLWQSSACSWAT